MAYSIGTVRKNDIEAFRLILPENYKADKDARYIGLLDEARVPVGVLCYKLSVDVADVVFIGAIDSDKRIEYGKIMLEYLENLLQEASLGVRIEIIWTKDEDAFYRELLSEYEEFTIVEDSEVYVITPEARRESDIYQKVKSQKGDVKKYRELDKKDREKIRRQLDEEDMVEFLEATDGRYMKEISFVSYDKDTLNAAIFFSRVIDGIELSFIYARNGHSKDLAAVLSEAMRVVDEKYPEEIIELTAVNDKAVSLVKDIFGDAIVAEKNFVGISFGRI